jgi:hypothetical protein
MPNSGSDSNLIRQGVFSGIKYAAIASAAVVSVYLLIALTGGSGAGGILGFIVIPIVSIFALPWVLIAMATIKLGGDWPLIIGLFGGLFVNGIIFGYFKGVSAKNARNRGADSVQP